jgi:hypothetical protein
MGIFLIGGGILLLISGARNSQGTLYSLLEADFTGSNNFFEFLIAIVLLGSLGFIPKLRGVSIALMSLVIVVIFLNDGTGFFSQLKTSLSKTEGATVTP